MISDLYYEESYKRNFDIINRRFELEMLKIESIQNFNDPFTYIFEKSQKVKPEESKSFLVTSEKDGSKKGFIGLINRIFESIKNFIKDFFVLIGNILTPGKHADSGDLISSNMGKVQVTKDTEKIYQSVQKEMGIGKRLIYKITHNTKVNPDTVNAFIDNGCKIFKNSAFDVATTVIAADVYKKQIEKNTGQLSKDNTWLAKACSECEGAEDRKLCSRIYAHLTKLEVSALNLVKDSVKKVKKEK